MILTTSEKSNLEKRNSRTQTALQQLKQERLIQIKFKAKI